MSAVLALLAVGAGVLALADLGLVLRGAIASCPTLTLTRPTSASSGRRRCFSSSM